MSRRLRLGMVGGGEGAFIGAVHRMAARLDDRYELVAGALSSDPQRNVRSGATLHLDASRVYPDHATMAHAEAGRDEGIDVVAIVTPNHLHFPVAKAFVEAGIHVICEKPMTTTLAHAHELAALVHRYDVIFGVTHNYSAYPMVRRARQLVEDGALGEIRVVQVEYAQDWLATPVERFGNRQAAWRTEPETAGAGCLGDIGSHAFHLATQVSGLRVAALACDARTFVEGRKVDDNAQVMLRFENGASGSLWVSQIATGFENRLVLRLFGTRASLCFSQEQPDRMWFTELGNPAQLLTRGNALHRAERIHQTRVPAGHPEGFIEAFADFYSGVADLVTAKLEKRTLGAQPLRVPSVEDGVSSVEFTAAAVESSRRNSAWIQLQP